MSVHQLCIQDWHTNFYMWAAGLHAIKLFHSSLVNKKYLSTAESSGGGKYVHYNSGSVKVHVKHQLTIFLWSQMIRGQVLHKEMNLLRFLKLCQADIHAHDLV